MNVYKLNYPNRKIAFFDLILKGVIIETENEYKYGSGIHSVVDIGNIMINPPILNGEEELVAPDFSPDYSIDIMSEQEINFESQSFPIQIYHNYYE